ncbi:MAG: hypothetical protein IPP91_12405 [Betaproteobacteria bacterium]|nr:hypothetical protein [Betaproteobacteria bacterium]
MAQAGAVQQQAPCAVVSVHLAMGAGWIDAAGKSTATGASPPFEERERNLF